MHIETHLVFASAEDSVSKSLKRPVAFASALGSQKATKEKEQHLVLVGGGHAHVQVIRALNSAARPSSLKVTLIDAQEKAAYSGMVPACVANFYTPEQTLISLRSLASWADIEFVHDRVVDIDLLQKTIHLQNAENSISFDLISLDIGSTTRDFDIVPGAREYTIPTRPIQNLVQRIDKARENLTDDTKIVVIGGGVAGLELAMTLKSRWKPFCQSLSCVVLDSGSELLPQESPLARKTLKNVLDDRNIVVRQNSVVKEVTENSVVLISGEIIPYTQCIWATGAGAHPLARHLSNVRGLDATEHGWIKVRPTLQSTTFPFVFAAGDCASIQDLPKGSPPKAGVFAVRAGPILIQNLPNFLEGKPLKSYIPQDDFMKILVCGDGKALAFRFGLALYGSWVFRMKDRIDQSFMKLFDVERLPRPQKGFYDTTQYDATDSEKAKNCLDPADAAILLQRTDDDVDHEQALLVLRGMADDRSYRDAVLSCTGVPLEILQQ